MLAASQSAGVLKARPLNRTTSPYCPRVVPSFDMAQQAPLPPPYPFAAWKPACFRSERHWSVTTLARCGLRAMKVALALPPSKRDLRLDLFRGLANWLMFLGHVSTSVLAWFSFRNYGFSDGADLFVFISGYTSALVFGRRMLEGGFIFGTTGLLLRYKPLNLDVLPLYVVLMGAFPPVLWLMIRHRNWVMLGSILLYFAARQFDWNLPSYPSGVWYFNPFAWQMLFALGAWLALGGANTLHFLVRSRTVLVFGMAYLLFAAVMTLSGLLPELQK